MKKILTIAFAAAALTACDIERLPYGSMAAEQITNNPSASLDALMNGVYAQLKTWSDPMHRCGEYAGEHFAPTHTTDVSVHTAYTVVVVIT